MSEAEKCPDCNEVKPDVRERKDNGLSIGKMCKECFDKLIYNCKQRSW